MKSSCTIFIAVFLLFSGRWAVVNGQSVKAGGANKKAAIKWATKPFNYRVFIENKGQWAAGSDQSPGDRILYGAQLGKVWAFFTQDGIIYRYEKFPAEKENTGKDDPDKEGHVKPTSYYLHVNWEGANPNVSIAAEQELAPYYTYPKDKNGTIKTHAFEKIIYNNLYAGIDVEFKFPANKDGFEYSLIIHPGADLSMVKLYYRDAKSLFKNKNGDIIIESDVGEITDHAPQGEQLTVSSDNGQLISASGSIDGSKEYFQAGQEYDKSKTLVIDPWVTSPNFTNYDAAYDICYDYKGNVYAQGGEYPYQLVKFNSGGAIQWTFTASSFIDNLYGAFAVDRKTGTSYITTGFTLGLNEPEILKVNTLGALLATYVGGATNIDEMWRAAYNPCYDDIVIGAGGNTATFQAFMLDTNLVNVPSVNFLNTTEDHHDVGLLCVDPSGLQCYMAIDSSDTYANDFINVFAQLPVPALSPYTYLLPDNFPFYEGDVPQYIDAQPGMTGAMNGMAASPGWLYMYDGQILQQFNKNTGILNHSIYISDSSEYWGGIDVDACDDIFLGCRDSVKYYNESLALQGNIPMPGYVYCLTLGQNDLLYAGGNGFVTALDVPSPARLIASTSSSPASCSACNGSASVTVNCGISPFTFLWSNGATTQTITGMCQGTYTVIVSDASCPPKIDTASDTISGTSGFTASAVDTNSDCNNNTGNITVYPNGGTSPYTYSWTNGATTQQITGLSAGIYTCKITDHFGCVFDTAITLIISSHISVTVVPAFDSICAGSSVPISASGANTYTWTPNTGLTCYNCPNPIASPSASTVYTVAATNDSGCSTTAMVTITVESPSILSATAYPLSICQGSIVTLSASATGINNPFQWQPGSLSGATVEVSPAVNTTYTVTVTNACGGESQSIPIHVNPSPTPGFSANILQGCSPLCIQFTDNSFISGDSIVAWYYLFGNGDSSSQENPLYCYPSPGNFSVRQTTVSDSGCSATLEILDMITVYTNPVAKFVATPQPTTLLEPTIQFTDKSTDAYGIKYWFWTFGDFDSVSNLQNPSHTYRDTGTYCANLVVINLYGCTDTTTNCIDIEPIFTLYIPDAFTPNGEGLNEIFIPKGTGIKTFEMYIFDRWGMQLFHSSDFSNGWNGTINGGNVICQQDTYVYMITVTDILNKIHNYIGRVTLLK